MKTSLDLTWKLQLVSEPKSKWQDLAVKYHIVKKSKDYYCVYMGVEEVTILTWDGIWNLQGLCG